MPEPIQVPPGIMVGQSAPAQVVVPNPAGGPAGYPTFGAYLTAFDEAKRRAEEEAWERARMQDMLARSARVDQQLKAISAAKKFIGTRALARDVESGIPFAQAAMRHPDAFVDTSTGMRTLAAAMQLQQPVQLGQTRVVTDPSGRRRGIIVQTGPSSGTFEADVGTEEAFPGQTRLRVSDLRDRAKALREEMSKASFQFKDESYKTQLQNERKTVEDELAQLLSGKQEAPQATPTSEINPSLEPMTGSTPQVKQWVWDIKSGKMVPRSQ